MTQDFVNHLRSNWEQLRQTKLFGLLRRHDVWTDGSFDRKNQFGGYAAQIFRRSEVPRTLMGVRLETKSHHMEIIAAAAALEAIPPSLVVIHTDSLSLCQIAVSRSRKYARRKESDPVKRLYAAIDLHPFVFFHKVPGHSGVRLNEEVDGLAKMAVREGARQLGIPLRADFGLISQGNSRQVPSDSYNPCIGA